MQKKLLTMGTAILGLSLTFSGCGGSGDSRGAEQNLPELEANGKILQFYNSNNNSQYAYVVEDGTVLNLQDPNIAEGVMVLDENKTGKFYTWTYDKADNNDSTNVEMIMMMDANYSYATDGNASYTDIYYMNHLHNEEIHPHPNTDFNPASGTDGTNKLNGLNTSLAAHYAKTQEIAVLPDIQTAGGLCGWHKGEFEFGTFYFAVGKNSGNIYVYDENLTLIDTDAMDGVTGCEVDKHGFTSTADGVLFFSAETQALHMVDSHDDGRNFHEHTVFPLSEIIGAGKTATTMTGIGEIEEDGHEH